MVRGFGTDLFGGPKLGLCCFFISCNSKPNGVSGLSLCKVLSGVIGYMPLCVLCDHIVAIINHSNTAPPFVIATFVLSPLC